MKRKVLGFVLFVVLLFGTVNAGADNGVGDILKDVKVNGFTSFGYNYNFNDPHTDAINFRPFNPNNRSLSLEVAELVFEKEAQGIGSAGFRTDLNYGYTVPPATQSTGYMGSGDFDLQQAYISYVAPIGSGLRIDVGKFITEIGAEVIEGYDGWNYNYSRSLLFYYTIPFTHTGVRGTYTVNDKLTLIGAIVNGWDNVTDNNNGKSWMVHAAITPSENLTFNLKYIGGPEQDDNNKDLRHVFNANLTALVGTSLEFNFDYVYGTEDNVPGTGDSNWMGLAGIVRYTITDAFAFNVRAEFLNDDDGSRTGTKQDMWEITLTPEYTLSDNLLVRAEYRHDASDKEVFDKGGTTAKSQDTLGVNVIFHF